MPALRAGQVVFVHTGLKRMLSDSGLWPWRVRDCHAYNDERTQVQSNYNMFGRRPNML